MGHQIAYSRSPMLHGYWLRTLNIDGAYDLKDLSAAEFPAFFAHLNEHGYVGGNITKPHKEAAFRLVDRREDAAEVIGAVNTVWYEGKSLVGGNTDWLGILLSLDDMHPGWDRSARTAVVIGAGGAARAAVFAFRERKLDVVITNRTSERASELAARFAGGVRIHDWAGLDDLLPGADLLINTTSLGSSGEQPLVMDVEKLKPDAVVYDVVYVPLETGLLRAARESGRRVVDGLSMLLYQAVPGFARWFGVTPTVTAELRAIIEADIRAKSAGG